MPSVKITRMAASDLESIQMRGLAEFGVSVVREFMSGFDRIFARLQQYPLHGARVPEYGRAVRACLHRPYRVLYRYEGGVVSILRIAHTSQRPSPIDDTRP